MATTTDLDSIKKLWDNAIYKPQTMFCLYIDSAFCAKRCGYCMYHSHTLKGKPEYDNYYKLLVSQIKDFKDIIENRHIDTIYFGGGTSSLMTKDIMKEVFDSIPNFKEATKKTFEGHPASLSKAKIDLLEEYKFTNLTMGVQTLDKEELKRQNRNNVTIERLHDLVDYAESKGISVNLDIMALINPDLSYDVNRVKDDINYIMSEIKPTSIDIYPELTQFNYLTPTDKITIVTSLRRSIIKALIKNKDYTCRANLEIIPTEPTLQEPMNYYIIRKDKLDTFNMRYDSSGIKWEPENQNTLSFGGVNTKPSYSYSKCSGFYYWTHIDYTNEKINYLLEGGM